eukprot:jgi/Orpsp1_1/1191792/evm.model.d7180000088548.1
MVNPSSLSLSPMIERETKKIKKEEDKPLLKQIEIQNLKMKIIENYEKKQWTIEYSPYKLKIIPPQDITITLNGLSDEIISMIFDYLNPSDVLEVLCISKELSKFSLHYLYEHPVISSLASLTQFLQQFHKIREEKPITLPVVIKSLTLSLSFYNEIVRNLNQSTYVHQLIQRLQEIFYLSYNTLNVLSLNFHIDNTGFLQLFVPIFQNYIYSNINTLRLKNPTKETLNNLLVCIPNLKYLCQDNYTNSFYVSVNELFSLDLSCQNNIKNFYYSLGEPLDTNLKRYLKSQNLGLWRILLNNNENNVII